MIVTAFLGTTETCLKWFDGLKFKMVLPFSRPKTKASNRIGPLAVRL